MFLCLGAIPCEECVNIPRIARSSCSALLLRKPVPCCRPAADSPLRPHPPQAPARQGLSALAGTPGRVCRPPSGAAARRALSRPPPGAAWGLHRRRRVPVGASRCSAATLLTLYGVKRRTNPDIRGQQKSTKMTPPAKKSPPGVRSDQAKPSEGRGSSCCPSRGGPATAGKVRATVPRWPVCPSSLPAGEPPCRLSAAPCPAGRRQARGGPVRGRSPPFHRSLSPYRCPP